MLEEMEMLWDRTLHLEQEEVMVEATPVVEEEEQDLL